MGESGTGHVPGWYRSLGRSRYDLPAGKVCCHTPAVVRWTSPVTADIRISGGIWLGRDLKRNQRWELAKNAVGFTRGTLEWGPKSGAPLTYAQGDGGEACLTLPVEEGDVIELSLGKAGVVGDFVGVELNLRTTRGYTIGERIISMPDKNQGTEWFEAPEPGWCGMTAHIGGLHLAQLRIVERMAQQVDDIKVTRFGAVNYTNADGTLAPVKGYGTYSFFPPEVLMLAMNYMDEGQVEFGLQLARKVWHNLSAPKATPGTCLTLCAAMWTPVNAPTEMIITRT